MGLSTFCRRSSCLHVSRSGGIKSNVGPLIADQYLGRRRRVVVLKTGERVIVDPDITIQTIFSRYYWYGNREDDDRI